VRFFSYFLSYFSVGVLLSSCIQKNVAIDQAPPRSKMMGESPPAYVQKAWYAKYVYDEEKRLLVPKYAGSRWGSIKEYREDGQLTYQDWWVRDVKVEDLEASPETQMSNLIDEENPLPSIKAEETAVESAKEVPASPPSAPEEQIEPVEDFVPSPFSPF
jgi:hypothetical protein